MKDIEVVDLIRKWYESEPDRRTSKIGIPNTALHLLEIFRSYWPLQEIHYLTRGAGQVATLSGASGDVIVARFATNLRSLGTEAGRTSRSTPGAARRFAKLLNQLSESEFKRPAARAQFADVAQRWIVNHILSSELSIVPISLDADSGILSVSIEISVNDLGERLTWRRAAAAILRAATDAAYPTADAFRHSNNDNDATIGDTAFIVADLGSAEALERCRHALSMDMKCLLVVPQDRVVGSEQLVEAAGLSSSVEVEGVGRLVSRIIDSVSEFDPDSRRELLSKVAKQLAARVS